MVVLAPLAGVAGLLVAGTGVFMGIPIRRLLKRITMCDTDVLPSTSTFGTREKAVLLLKKIHIETEDNAQRVTCAHKLLVSHVAMIRKFTEAISTQSRCSKKRNISYQGQCRSRRYEEAVKHILNTLRPVEETTK